MFKLSKIYPYFIFVFIIALFYGNTLNNGFVHDDVWQIQTNNTIKSFQNITKIFTGCISEDLVGGCRGEGYYYRPLQNLFYLFTFQISSKPSAFHFLNLILLFLVSLTAFILFKLLFKSQIEATLAVVLFITNPLISEVVNWVSSLPELLMTIFILSSISFILFYKNSEKITHLVVSLAFLSLALLSKETAVFLSFLIPIAYLLLPNQESLFNKKSWLILGLTFSLVLISFLIRILVLGRVVYEYEGYYGMNFYEQLLNGFYFYGKYLEKLIYPLPLSFQTNFLPVKNLNFEVILGAVLVLSNLALGFFLFKKRFNLLLFGLVLINISILPALVFINKIGEFLFSERYLFFATVGYGFLISIIYFDLFKKYHKLSNLKFIAIFLLSFYLLFSFLVVIKRNEDWKNNIASYTAMIKIDSKNSRAYFQRGEVYLDEGELERAKKDYKSALKIDPSNLLIKQKLANFPIKYQAKNGLYFIYPKSWTIKEDLDQINLETVSSAGKSQIQIRIFSIDNFKEEERGTLVSSGPALIPNFDKASVKIWENKKNAKIIEFYLIKNKKLINLILENPQNSLKEEFNLFLGSINL